MAYTFGSAINDVAAEINQDLSGDTKTVTLTEVKRWLNQAYRKLQLKVIESGQNYYLQETDADLVANQKDLSLPTDALRVLRLEVGYASSEDREVAQKVDLNDIREDVYTGGTGQPLFAVFKKKLRIFPTPTANVTDGAKLFYYPQVAELSNTSDEFDLPLGLEDIPTGYAVIMAKAKKGLIRNSDEVLRMWLQGIDDEIALLIERVEDEPDKVRITTPAF